MPVCAAFGVSLAMVLDGASFGQIIGALVPILLSVVVHLAFWTTLVFVVLERTGHQPLDGGAWSLDSLPQPRQKGVGLGDMVSSLVFLAIMVGVVLWDLFVGFVPTEPGLSFLDPGLWPWWILGLFLVMALEAVLAIVVYALGRWTAGLAVANGILNLVIAVPALWLLFEGRLINPEYFSTIVPDDAAAVEPIVATVVGFVIAGVAIWDTIDASLKAVRARR